MIFVVLLGVGYSIVVGPVSCLLSERAPAVNAPAGMAPRAHGCLIRIVAQAPERHLCIFARGALKHHINDRLV